MPALLPGRLRSVGRDGFRLAVPVVNLIRWRARTNRDLQHPLRIRACAVGWDNPTALVGFRVAATDVLSRIRGAVICRTIFGGTSGTAWRFRSMPTEFYFTPELHLKDGRIIRDLGYVAKT